jgi:hypothetical protein
MLFKKTLILLVVVLLLYPLSVAFAFRYFYSTTPQVLPAGIVIRAAHDIAVSNLTSRTVFGQGFTYGLNVTCINQGSYTESFNVSLSANTTEIARLENITLPNDAFTTSTIVWNTTEFSRGFYNLTTCAEPVPDESNITNNNCTAIVRIGFAGDVSSATVGSPDGTVNMRDVQYLILRFNTNPSSPNWNINADINDDSTVNMRDVQIAILNFGKHE